MMRSVVLILAMTLSACATEPELDDVDGVEVGLLILNSLPPETYHGNKAQLESLMRLPLGTNQQSTYLVSDKLRVELFKKAVGCALEPGQTVSIKDNQGVFQKFSGELGLAPQWTQDALEIADRNWVTACVVARFNLFGIEVEVDLLAPVQGWEKATLGWEEAAYYVDVDGLRVCGGDGAVSDCPGGWAPYIDQRVCGSSPSCGLIIDGECSRVCSRKVDDHWEDCNGAKEVITVRSLFVKGQCL
jgi:hypothetical protein